MPPSYQLLTLIIARRAACFLSGASVILARAGAGKPATSDHLLKQLFRLLPEIRPDEASLPATQNPHLGQPRIRPRLSARLDSLARRHTHRTVPGRLPHSIRSLILRQRKNTARPIILHHGTAAGTQAARDVRKTLASLFQRLQRQTAQSATLSVWPMPVLVAR